MPNTIRRHAARAWEAANARRERERERSEPLRPVGLHECRHVFRTWLDEAGVREATIDDVLGHSRPGVGERYRHVTPQALTDAAAKLDDYLARADAAGRVEHLEG